MALLLNVLARLPGAGWGVAPVFLVVGLVYAVALVGLATTLAPAWLPISVGASVMLREAATAATVWLAFTLLAVLLVALFRWRWHVAEGRMGARLPVTYRRGDDSHGDKRLMTEKGARFGAPEAPRQMALAPLRWTEEGPPTVERN